MLKAKLLQLSLSSRDQLTHLAHCEELTNDPLTYVGLRVAFTKVAFMGNEQL